MDLFARKCNVVELTQEDIEAELEMRALSVKPSPALMALIVNVSGPF